ncbi:MAG: hypothetical protein ABFS56_22375 [Pseudomonadota bacterium]
MTKKRYKKLINWTPIIILYALPQLVFAAEPTTLRLHQALQMPEEIILYLDIRDTKSPFPRSPQNN